MGSVDATLSAEHANLLLQLHGHKKHNCGSKSESSPLLALKLILEEIEHKLAAETEDAASDPDATKPPRTPRK